METIIKHKEKKIWNFRRSLFFILHLSFFILLAGCSNDEDTIAETSPVAVQFGTGNIAMPKTTDGGDQWVNGDKIGIFMTTHNATSISGNIKENADNIQYTADNAAATSSFSPVSGTPIYYPVSGNKVDFISYYPYKTSLSNYTYPVDVSTQTTPADIDVLYAKATNAGSGYDKNSGTVDLQFSHVLSKLSFTLASGTGSPDLTGAKVEISNVFSTATMELKDGSLTTTNSNQTITANTAANGLTSSAIMLPQTLSPTTKLIVTLSDDKSKFEWTFTTAAFLEGKEHTYTITVDRTGITVTTGNITDWTGTGDNPTEGGAGYKVGDYYPDPTNASTAIGVVFWVDPADSRHGKVVGLQETTGHWGVFGKDEDADGVTGIRSLTDGKTATHNLIEKRKDELNFSSDYYVFNWIYQTMNNGNLDGKWYLPAFDELETLYNAKAAVNTGLTSAGGTTLSNAYYWSSSEFDLKSAYIVNFGASSFGIEPKEYGNNRARCVLAF